MKIYTLSYVQSSCAPRAELSASLARGRAREGACGREFGARDLVINIKIYKSFSHSLWAPKMSYPMQSLRKHSIQ